MQHVHLYFHDVFSIDVLRNALALIYTAAVVIFALVYIQCVSQRQPPFQSRIRSWCQDLATREIRNAIIDGVHGQTGTITN